MNFNRIQEAQLSTDAGQGGRPIRNWELYLREASNIRQNKMVE